MADLSKKPPREMNQSANPSMVSILSKRGWLPVGWRVTVTVVLVCKRSSFHVAERVAVLGSTGVWRPLHPLSSSRPSPSLHVLSFSFFSTHTPSIQSLHPTISHFNPSFRSTCIHQWHIPSNFNKVSSLNPSSHSPIQLSAWPQSTQVIGGLSPPSMHVASLAP